MEIDKTKRNLLKEFEKAKDSGRIKIEFGFVCNPDNGTSAAFINRHLITVIPYGKEEEFSDAIRAIVDKYKDQAAKKVN